LILFFDWNFGVFFFRVLRIKESARSSCIRTHYYNLQQITNTSIMHKGDDKICD